ncbi:MAG TPA: alpha-L-fucosidase, partial [Kofleriaceae bacterium]|nr:alpha-L-fucosidase [Kofleriaceae bacterium]
FNCARMTSGSVRCWGASNFGQLGYGDTETVGDNETPASAGNVSLGGDVAFLAQGGSATGTCAVLEDLVTVRCWGANGQYQLGLGHNEHIGDTELPDSQDPVQVLDPE